MKKWNRGPSKSLFFLTVSTILAGTARVIADYHTDGPERITASYLIAHMGVFGGGWLIISIAVILVHLKSKDRDND